MKHTTVTGAILAGGLAKRMGQQDKGLVLYQGQPLVSYALAAMQAITASVLINANRNADQYRAFGVPVIADLTLSFDGPLAGVLAAMKQAKTQTLLVMPCDCPLVIAEHLQALLTVYHENQADIAVVYDGQRLQPLFMAVDTGLQNDLQDYLANGGRRVDNWLSRHSVVTADFSSQASDFLNINTLAELTALEQLKTSN